MKPTSTQNPSRPHRFNRLQRLQALLFALILMLSSLGLPVIAEETPEEQAVQEAAAPNVYGVVVVGELEEKQLTADLGGDSQISVLYGKNANIPDGAELRVSPIADASAYEEQAKKDLNVKSVDFVQLFDMGIYYDGVKIEPAEKVKIRFRLTEDMKREGDLRIVHFPTDPVPATQEPEPAPVPAAAPKKLMAVKGAKAAPTAVEPQSEDDDDDLMPVQAASVDMPITEELTPVLEDENMVSFETYSFSVFGVCYTVDFYYGEFEYHLTGEESMTLSALFAALGIDRSAADAVNVIFSNPELLAVAQTEDGADWTLTSLKPFNTTETLTVDFRNGDQIVVRVEDNRNYYATFNVNDSNAGWLLVQPNGEGDAAYYGPAFTVPVSDNGVSSDKVWPHTADEDASANDTVSISQLSNLQATPGYQFVGWTYNGTNIYWNVDGQGAIRPSLDAATTYTASFKPVGQHLVTYVAGEHGTIQGNRYFYTTNNVPMYFNYSGDSQGATATPDEGYKFDGWYDGDTLISIAQTFDLSSLTENKLLTARFSYLGLLNVTYRSFNSSGSVGRIAITGHNYENPSGNQGEDSESVSWGNIPSGATSSVVGTDWVLLAWRDQNNRVLTRNSTLTLSEPVYTNTTYSAQYVGAGTQVVLLYSNNEDYGRIEINKEDKTNSTWPYDINNGLVSLHNTASATPYEGYVLDHWEYNGEELEYYSTAIKDIGKPTNGTNIQELKAVFLPPVYITYDLGEIKQVGNNSPYYQHWQDVPWCSNVQLSNYQADGFTRNGDVYSKEVNRRNPGTASGLTSLTRVSQTDNGYNLLTHTFRGWKRSDTGAIIQPGEDIGEISGSITLTAQWSAYFPYKGTYYQDSDPRAYRFNTNTCGFFVRLFDSTFDKGDTRTYTDCLYTSRLVDGSYANNDVRGARADFYGNSDETVLANINAIDTGIRAIGNGYLTSDNTYTANRYSAFDGTTLMLEGDFPSDDFIFGRIRQWNLTAPANRKIQINGHQIPQDMLTSDYFDIKWYVLKDQENSWHIDGMLIPKYAKLVVTKTFVGPEAALTAAKEGYSINVEEQDPKGGNAADTWTLTLTQTTGNNVTVYHDTANNQYVWVLDKLVPMQQYVVTETGYTATANGITYTVTPSYRITNTRQATTSGNTFTATIDHVYSYADSVTWPSIQTVAFTNQYTEPYVMTIMKQDGTTLHGLKGVYFDFVMKKSSQEIVLSEVCHSDANGKVSIHFQNTLEGNFTFTLDERPYDGYQALATVTGSVNIAADGKVTLSNVQTIISGNNTTAITPDANDPSIIYLINHPERKRVVVNKIWTNNSDARPVTMQLLRNGVPMSGMYVVLGASEATAQGVTPVKVTGWTYTWNDLPAYVDGTEVIYTAREEWIGEPGGVDSIHYNTGNDSDGYLEYIVNQSQTVTTVTEGENTVTIVNVRVENTRDNGQIMFSKVDTGKKAVNGAVFAVFPDSGNFQGPPSLDTPCVKKLDETDATYKSVNGVVTIDNLAHPNADNWYWLREISTPAGYEDHSNYWYLLNIKGNNSRMYDYGVNGEFFSLSQNVDSVENKPFTANVKVIKTGTNNAALSGAVFSLHRSFLGFMVPAPIRGYEALTTNSSGELAYANGTPIIFTLEEGVYFLKEESAPAGYIPLQNPIRLEIRDKARPEYSNVLTATIQNDPLSVTTDGNYQVLTVPNTPGVELPSTGGPGTAAYLAVGLALMALALILTRLRKRVQA